MAEYPPAADRPGTSGPAGDDGLAASDPATNGPATNGPAASSPAANDPVESDTAANDRTADQDGDRTTDEPVSDRAERSGDSTDDVFLAMVARFDDEPTDGGWPAAENVSEPRRSSAVTDWPDPSTPQHGPRDDGMVTENLVDAATEPGTRRGDDALKARDDIDDVDIDIGGVDDEDDEHFEPPPAPPAPRMKPVTRLALGSIALGLAILFVPTFVGYRSSSTQELTGVLLILGGVGTLVAKMGDRPPTDSDGPDDGAVI